MRMPVSALLTIGLIIGPACSRVQQISQPDIVGVYECQGMNPDGTEYKGFVEITAVSATFRVHWTMDDGEDWGVGILKGDVFVVSYWGGAPAVVVYRVDGNRLIGEWTMGGAEGRTYSEVLTKTDKRPLPPEQRKPPAPSPHPQPGTRI